MTTVPLGAHLAPADLPPPPPSADPREPSAVASSRRSGARSPQRARSPISSRDVSPMRNSNRSPVSEDASPMLQPFPRASPAVGTPPPQIPHQASLGTLGHHLSRPSSPSSIHSSGSAIFERDIEHPPLPSLALGANPPHSPHTLNHKPSRVLHLSHGSNLDHTVPAVLDDAVEALTLGGATSRGLEGLEIEAPTGNPAGMTRQSSTSLTSSAGRKLSTGPSAVWSPHSRSSSPVSTNSRPSSVASPHQSPPILAQLSPSQTFTAPPATFGAGRDSPASPTSPTAATASVPRPAAPRRISTGPQLPGGWVKDSTITPGEERSSSVPAPAAAAPLSGSPSPSPVPPHLSPSKSKPHHRLSFVSYNDILLSVPTQVTSFGEITSGTVSPDHLPGTVSPSLSSRSPAVGQGQVPSLNGFPSAANSLPARQDAGSPVPASSLTSAAAAAGATGELNAGWEAGRGGSGALGLGEGEWQREGLGKGLEQRLEDLAQVESQGQAAPLA
ncbi:hypothetical protein L202_00305 [Cryptococcus amylolentus CBS 6039]|uniref:Uncharacterized protein n=1 Tax=Cryptococcus amylolentus CBS 6039 TaxID=1295533 RepID=A0A1E3I6Y2_9TREE|nr:hypothetical protein L202_00305 [Cryptococcus amylolentus CBS 6039]ODN84332.1 hypothetical protein L202_00305 [Cryptococcus amylolentus CBS 6039]